MWNERTKSSKYLHNSPNHSPNLYSVVISSHVLVSAANARKYTITSTKQTRGRGLDYVVDGIHQPTAVLYTYEAGTRNRFNIDTHRL